MLIDGYYLHIEARNLSVNDVELGYFEVLQLGTINFSQSLGKAAFWLELLNFSPAYVQYAYDLMDGNSNSWIGFYLKLTFLQHGCRSPF